MVSSPQSRENCDRKSRGLKPHRRMRVDEVDSARKKLDTLLANIFKSDSQEEDDIDEDDEQTDSSPQMKRRRPHKKSVLSKETKKF